MSRATSSVNYFGVETLAGVNGTAFAVEAAASGGVDGSAVVEGAVGVPGVKGLGAVVGFAASNFFIAWRIMAVFSGTLHPAIASFIRSMASSGLPF